MRDKIKRWNIKRPGEACDGTVPYTVPRPGQVRKYAALTCGKKGGRYTIFRRYVVY